MQHVKDKEVLPPVHSKLNKSLTQAFLNDNLHLPKLSLCWTRNSNRLLLIIAIWDNENNIQGNGSMHGK